MATPRSGDVRVKNGVKKVPGLFFYQHGKLTKPADIGNAALVADTIEYLFDSDFHVSSARDQEVLVNGSAWTCGTKYAE